MSVYRLRNRCVLSLRNKAAEFVRQYSSNVLEAPRNAFLDIRGKIVAVFDQKKIDEDHVLVVIEKPFFERLKKHLEKYLFLSDTWLIEEVYRVYFDLLGVLKPEENEFVIPQIRGQLFLSQKELPSTVTDEEFTRFRVENAIPLQGVDFDNELLLEVGDEEFVSYTKGCYLGQEIIARVHHRGKPARKLMVASDDQCSPDERTRLTSKVLDPKTGKAMGFLFVSNT